ncbi:MAG: hypothetical protein WD824_10380 [Cyclobacteriaceae bacterium]
MNEKQFWDWFLENRFGLEQFILSNTDDYSRYHELTDKLKGYNEHVIAELTMDSSDNHVLILSCDGRRDGIRPVETLFKQAPHIDKWIVQKFRSPGHVAELNYQGLNFKSKDVSVRYSVRENYYDIQLFIRGYKNSDIRYKGLAFLYLDHLLGEYNVMTRIGTIDFKRPSLLTNTSDMVTLLELRAIIERLN